MIDAIKERRSCRSFDREKPIPKEIIEEIIKAATNAPTGCNYQSFDFVVVTGKDKIKEIADLAYSFLAEGMKKMITGSDSLFYGATCLIAIVPARAIRDDCFPYDQGIIANSISVAAQLHGLGSLQVGSLFMTPPEELNKLIELPMKMSPLAVVIGYPGQGCEPMPKEMKAAVKYID